MVQNDATVQQDRVLGVGDRQFGAFEAAGHKVASSGRIYGAPAWVKNENDLKKLRRRLNELAVEGAEGRQQVRHRD